MIFEIDNVELYFSNKRILNGVYLKAETGKVTGILGGNGCGKSSLLNIIFGSLNPKFKLIRIDNKPILKTLYLTQTIKYLPQYSIIPSHLKLKTIFNLFKVDWNTFEILFESFSIYKNQKTKNLSGGEKRLVETYIILKSSSKIVLLDELFSHLSPIYIEIIKTIIEEEKLHKTIIITDHMYRHIIDVSDEIYLLKNGCTKLIKNILELEDYKYLSIDSI